MALGNGPGAGAVTRGRPRGCGRSRVSLGGGVRCLDAKCACVGRGCGDRQEQEGKRLPVGALHALRGGGPSAATESRLAPTPRRSRAFRASHAVVRSRASLMWISSVFRRDGDGVEVDHAASAGHRGSGHDGAGARDIERISSGQRSHFQGLGVAAHVVRSTPAHPCGAGRKSLWADARRTIRRTGRFGRESYGGTPKSGFRPTFSPYARFQGTGVYGKNRRSSPRTGPRKALAVFLRKRCTSDRASCRGHEIGRGRGVRSPSRSAPGASQSSIRRSPRVLSRC